eukprot:457468_1
MDEDLKANWKEDTNNTSFLCGNKTENNTTFPANNISFSWGNTPINTNTNTNTTEEKSDDDDDSTNNDDTEKDDDDDDSTPIIDWLKDNNLNDIKLKEALIDEEIENIDDLLIFTEDELKERLLYSKRGIKIGVISKLIKVFKK